MHSSADKIQPSTSTYSTEDDPSGVFQCEYPKCTKRFTTKFSLKRHYYIHSRQKTFPCQFCTKVFALP